MKFYRRIKTDNEIDQMAVAGLTAMPKWHLAKVLESCYSRILLREVAGNRRVLDAVENKTRIIMNHVGGVGRTRRKTSTTG